MKKLFLFIFIAILIIASEQALKAQTAPIKQWDKTFGGINQDELHSLLQTSDGGYILGGWSASGINGDKTSTTSTSSTGIPGKEYWILKLSTNGSKLWDKSFGGGCGSEELYSIQQTNDGGFILGGSSWCGNYVDKSQPNQGGSDYWIIKVDSIGNKVWDKAFGGPDDDQLISIKQTTDGGYILGGNSKSGIGGNKSQACRGAQDYWIVKVDATGNKVWDKTFGGGHWEYFSAAQQTKDGGYIIGGYTSSDSTGDMSQHNRGMYDFWILKIDANGNKVWDKTFGGNQGDIATCLVQYSNGTYIIGGGSRSGISGDKSQPSYGGDDFWLIKIDSIGHKLWDKTIRGSTSESIQCLQKEPDGGLLLGGSSQSNIWGDKSENSRGGTDYWIVKTDANGNRIWDKTIGGIWGDFLTAMQQTADNGYILGGYSESIIGGDKTQTARGQYDYWVVKLGPDCPALTATLKVECIGGNVAVKVDVTGIPSSATGIPSWTLTYNVNGVTQTTTGTSNSFTLTSNAAVGTIYTLVNIASSTCTNNLTNSLTVPAPLQQPTISLISPDTLISSVTGSSYTWKFNNTTLPNTNRKLKATSNGTYAVQVKDVNNCISAFSPDYAFVVSGLKESSASEIKLYPNPTTSLLNLEFANPINAHVKVYNGLGQCILTQTISKQEKQTTLDLANAAKGIYTIQVIAEKQSLVKKIVLE